MSMQGSTLGPSDSIGPVEQLRRLGVREGGVVVVHTSYRAVRPIEGGPAGLIEALLEAVGPRGTLAMPSWTGDADAPFDPATTPAAEDLGVIADMFWRIPGVARSPHPEAFAAKGPLAERIVSGDLPLPPHVPDSPIGRVHDLDGQVLLLGVGHDANTTLHLAECIAGVPYGIPNHVTVLTNAKPHRIDYMENDHCCQRFALADGWLESRGLQRRGPVGHGEARLMRSRDVVAVATEALARDPLTFLHPAGAGCAECDAARASVPRGAYR